MNKLKELRKTTKYSQADVANLIGISRQAYCTYENGSREPDIATLIKIADFFNVSVDYVINHQREHLEVYEETKAKLIEKLKKRNISVSDLNNLNDNDLDVILRVAKQFMENKKKHE